MVDVVVLLDGLLGDNGRNAIGCAIASYPTSSYMQIYLKYS